jgi:mRNA interferase MazF
MKSGRYIPDRGDLVWIDLDPTRGHEQGGRRPAIVLSAQFYNARSKLLVACPITSRVKGYTFEVPVPDGLAVEGVVLADHVRTLDWNQRTVSFIEHAPAVLFEEVTDRVAVLLGFAP